MNYFRLCTVSMVVALAATCSAGSSDESPSVTVVGNGVRTQLDAHDPRVERLVELVEEALSGADGVLRLAVSRRLIDELTHSHESVEIRFPAQRVYHARVLQRDISLGGVLIPLSGEFAQEDTVILFLWDQTYRPGPLTSSQGLAVIRQAVKEGRSPQ